ncbi:hypothetical protein ACIOG8_37460 [Streptomyces erythrochromogenes]|uniref:hypothetical protein n=1 Tax=Streptomyces erythrochromogenes TaxID=285574 RepID=UPI00382310EF
MTEHRAAPRTGPCSLAVGPPVRTGPKPVPAAIRHSSKVRGRPARSTQTPRPVTGRSSVTEGSMPDMPQPCEWGRYSGSAVAVRSAGGVSPADSSSNEAEVPVPRSTSTPRTAIGGATPHLARCDR